MKELYNWANEFINESDIEELFDYRRIGAGKYIAITKELIGGDEYEEYDSEDNLVDSGVTPLQIGSLYIEVGKFDKDENGKEIKDIQHFTPAESVTLYNFSYDSIAEEINYLVNITCGGI